MPNAMRERYKTFLSIQISAFLKYTNRWRHHPLYFRLFYSSDEWSIYYVTIHTDDPPTISCLYGVKFDRRTFGKILNVVAKYNNCSTLPSF